MFLACGILMYDMYKESSSISVFKSHKSIEKKNKSGRVTNHNSGKRYNLVYQVVV